MNAVLIRRKLGLLCCLGTLLCSPSLFAQDLGSLRGGLLLLSSSSVAPQSWNADERAEPALGLRWLDWFIIAGYGLGMLTLGVYFSRRQTSTRDYFIAGGNLGGFVVGISLFATLLSSISYLAHPGEVIKHGPVVLIGHLSIPIVYLVVGYLLIPVYMRQRVTSGYQLLQERLGTRVRLLAAALFVLQRLVWMSLMIHLASRTLLFILGLNGDQLYLVTAITGLVAITYTSLGGLRAVVITDLFQLLLLLGGALGTVALITLKTGGVSGWWPPSWPSHWDSQPLFSLDPHVRVTVVGALISTMVWQMSTAGGDQTAIQRYMSTRDALAARRAYLTFSFLVVIVFGVLMLVGLALLGYFQANPWSIPAGGDLTAEADLLFPHYIAHHLPMGMSGLVISAMLAAAMSSLDSGVNSITAVVTTDFLDRSALHLRSEKDRVRKARLLAFSIGVVVVHASLLMEYVPGNFLEIAYRTTSLLGPLIFALFLLALFVPFTTPKGAALGVAYGLTSALPIAFWDVITGGRALSFQWIGVTSLVVTLLVASFVSLAERLTDREAARFAVPAAAILPLLAAFLWLRFL